MLWEREPVLRVVFLVTNAGLSADSLDQALCHQHQLASAILRLAMNQYEELLLKASACLSEASKIGDSAVRAKVLELVYQAQLVAQAGILREVEAEAAPSALPPVTGQKKSNTAPGQI